MDPDQRAAARDALGALWDRELWVYLCWSVGLVLASFVGGLLMNRLWGDADASAWHWAASTPKGLLLILGAALATVDLPRWVAHGITRRAFALAAGAVTAALAVAGGVLITAGYAVEAALHGAGSPPALDGAHLFATTAQWHLILGEYTLLYAAWAVSGWLAGAGYYRWGWRGGTLFIVPAALPLVVAEALARSNWPATGTTVTLIAIVAVVLAGAVAAYRVVGDMPLRPGWTA